MHQFKYMLEYFVKMLISSPPHEKCVVHCSAGIGRTGTTIALAHCIMNMSALRNAGEQPKCSVFSTVRRMREQRNGLVQMPEQYVFIYQFLAYYLGVLNFS